MQQKLPVLQTLKPVTIVPGHIPAERCLFPVLGSPLHWRFFLSRMSCSVLQQISAVKLFLLQFIPSVICHIKHSKSILCLPARCMRRVSRSLSASYSFAAQPSCFSLLSVEFVL